MDTGSLQLSKTKQRKKTHSVICTPEIMGYTDVTASQSQVQFKHATSFLCILSFLLEIYTFYHEFE